MQEWFLNTLVSSFFNSEFTIKDETEGKEILKGGKKSPNQTHPEEDKDLIK